jgi:CRP-like cAMP-binding protein
MDQKSFFPDHILEHCISGVREHLESFEPLSDELWEKIKVGTRFFVVNKNERLLDIGQNCDYLYIVLNGCLRYSYHQAEKEMILAFFEEKKWVTIPQSLLTNKPSKYTLEASENTLVLGFHKSHLIELREDPRLKTLSMKLLEEGVNSGESIMHFHLFYNPEEKYLWLIENYSTLLQRVPQHLIASFMGITPVSLSRIRARLAKSPKLNSK